MAQVYKVVDEDGNVTYTDQAAGRRFRPIELPPISVIEAPNYETAPATDQQDSDSADGKEMSLTYLRKNLQGFRDRFPATGGVGLASGWTHTGCLEHQICITGRYAGDHIPGWEKTFIHHPADGSAGQSGPR